MIKCNVYNVWKCFIKKYSWNIVPSVSNTCFFDVPNDNIQFRVIFETITIIRLLNAIYQQYHYLFYKVVY